MNKSSPRPSYKQPSKLAANANAEPDVCDRCEELDKKIAHFRQLAARVLDPLLTEGVGKMIEEMEAQKATFHPEQQK
jgi:hypothetical protein